MENMLNPSICSHLDIEKNNIRECRKCGRKVVEKADGFRFYYLANGVHYFTKRPNKK